MPNILRDKELNAVINALQRRDDLYRDMERAERCDIDCHEQKKRADAAYAFLDAINREFITSFQL